MAWGARGLSTTYGRACTTPRRQQRAHAAIARTSRGAGRGGQCIFRNGPITVRHAPGARDHQGTGLHKIAQRLPRCRDAHAGMGCSLAQGNALAWRCQLTHSLQQGPMHFPRGPATGAFRCGSIACTHAPILHTSTPHTCTTAAGGAGPVGGTVWGWCCRTWPAVPGRAVAGADVCTGWGLRYAGCRSTAPGAQQHASPARCVAWSPRPAPCGCSRMGSAPHKASPARCGCAG